VKLRNAMLGGLGLWAGWRLLGPESAPRYSPGQRRPLRIPGRTVFVGERELFLRETGPVDGPPLVLVHGWSLDGEMTFHRIIEPLAEHFRVVMPDHRNHGKSDWIRGSFDIADLADETAGVMDAIGLGPATVFGYSLGGMVAQELARRHPGKVERMILGATAAQPIGRFRPAARGAMWLARAVSRISTQEIAAGTSHVMLRAGALDPEHHRWMRSGLLRRDPTLFYETGHALWRFDSRSWVGKLPHPAMVIIPTKDQVVEPRAQYALAALLPDAEIVELQGARHESILADPDTYIRLIRDFAG